MSERERGQIAPDKTRLAVSIPADTYLRLSTRCGTKPGSLWKFVDRAINAELEREQELAAPSA